MTLFDSMVAALQANGDVGERNAMHEAMQQIALAGLARGGFFNVAAFYGGTCLHLFHNLKRFSEDLDFSLICPDSNFHFETYFEAVKEEFHLAGRDVVILAKRKMRPADVESAFLKATSDVFDIGFTAEKQIKVKLEVDTNPPLDFNTEMKLLLLPASCWVRTIDLPCLFAGKVHAVLYRHWKTRVKGRDWYDFAWYVTQGVELDIAHLEARCRQTDPTAGFATRKSVIDALDAKIDIVDFSIARKDVEPFIADFRELAIWSRDYFHALVRQLRIKIR